MKGEDRYLVTYDQEAAWEINGVKGASDRDSLQRVVDRLARMGPEMGPANMKLLRGAPGILELRPRAGDSAFRLLAVRAGPHYVILAVVTKKKFAKGLFDAQTRLKNIRMVL